MTIIVESIAIHILILIHQQPIYRICHIGVRYGWWAAALLCGRRFSALSSLPEGKLLLYLNALAFLVSCIVIEHVQHQSTSEEI